jgi:hypothetical protein
MDRYIKRDQAFRRTALWAQGLYAVAGLLLAATGNDAHQRLMALGSLLLIPLIWGAYALFGLERGYQLEVWIYGFAFLSFTLGGCAEFYTKIQGFDKIMHALSGAFVTLMALALYLYLERARPIEQQSALTATLFVFFASMAVAALFEIGEYILAPIVGRDLQHVAGTGVTDTMTDMMVCLAGTLIALPFVARFFRGGHDPFTSAAAAFLYKNLPPTPVKVSE